MRKRRKTNVSIIRFMILFIIPIFFMAIAYSIIYVQTTIQGTAKLKGHEYSGWGTVTATKTHSWGNYMYQYDYVITNTSNANISGWEIKMNIPTDTIVTTQSGGIVSVNNGIITIIDNGNNSFLAPGATMQAEIQIQTSEPNFECNFLMLNGIEMNLTGETVDPTAIAINESSVSLYPNQIKDLVVIFTPSNGYGEVTWTSSDISVATVDSSGVITSASAGNCTITATCNGLTATCPVQVKSAVAVSENLNVEFVAKASWPGNNSYYNVQYIVNATNITETNINTWSFDVVLPSGCSYNGGWCATITNTSGTTYHVESTMPISAGATNGQVGITFLVPSIEYIPIATNITTQ